MKKLLVVLAFLILPSVTFAANTITPSTYSAFTDSLTLHLDANRAARAYALDGEASFLALFVGDNGPVVVQAASSGHLFFTTGSGGDLASPATFHVLIFDRTDGLADACWQEDPTPDLNDWATCSPLAIDDLTVTYGSTPPPDPSPTPTGVAALIATASSTFMTDLGFNWLNVTNLMKSMMTLVMGSGLGVLKLMLPLVLVLIIITAIVYFLYRAFRFFRH